MPLGPHWIWITYAWQTDDPYYGRNLAALRFWRGTPEPQWVDRPGAEYLLVRQQDGVAITESSDHPELRSPDGCRMVQLRAYRWNARRAIWEWQAWMTGLWMPESTELAIGNLEVPEARHRGCGLGTALLIETFQVADRLGARVITGDLSDLHDVPRLKRWYGRHGFAIGPPKRPGTAASIRLDGRAM